MAGSFTLDIRGSFDGLVKSLQVFDRDRNFVAAMAMNYTAEDIKAAAIDQMQRDFDRPTRFTLNALETRRANKHDLHAEVRWKHGGNKAGRPDEYLSPQVEGGGRVPKRFERALQHRGILRSNEYAVPGAGLTLNAYGNMRGGDIERILSHVGAAEMMAGYQANATGSRRSKAKRKKSGRYFVLRGTRAPDGIYLRRGLREIVPVLIFVSQPQYAKRFAFYELAQRITEQNFARNYERAVRASDVFAAFGR